MVISLVMAWLTSGLAPPLLRTLPYWILLSPNVLDSWKSAARTLITWLILQLPAISQGVVQDTRMDCLPMSKTKESQTLSLASGPTCAPSYRSVRFQPHMEVLS